MDLNKLRELSGIEESCYHLLEDNIREMESLEEAFVKTEGVSIDQLQMMFDAARRGLGLANKLRPEDKKKHLKRIMSNLNTIRAALKRLIKQM